MTPDAQSQLHALAGHLRQRRNDLLVLWRDAVRRDPELTTSASLSRSALDDHIPKILADLERRLRAEHAMDATQVDLEQRQDAAEHGRHRWQQGYDIRETMREWGHLQSIVLDELERYSEAHPSLERSVLATARASLAALCMEGNCESAARHVRLQQTEAASLLRDFETTLAALQALENERASLLRETAHDLRGSVGVIANTTALLASPAVSGARRDHFYDLLQKRIRSMGTLLTDLVDLARLEAGKDPPEIESFDAAARIREYCDLLRPLAAERNLFLRYDGPRSLPVEGDLLKLQRIVQNLLLNAMHATQRGGIIVRSSREGERQWALSIADTGPGFALQSVGPLRHALKTATDEAHRVAIEGAVQGPDATRAQSDPPLAAASGPGSASLPSGEGIGLSIVKRLCDALGATVELETAPGHGTTIRILFPLRYPERPLAS
ncbi:MAG: ATP-binding protein [Steroidobacteraceae bacterium]